MAAHLLGQGYTVSQVAERLVDYIIQNSDRELEVRCKSARNRIRKWRKKQIFRDAVWHSSIIRLDNELPQIVAGVAKKAKAGRVDAAKLAFALTERYVEKGEVQATQVEVIFQGIPRPQPEADLELEAEEVTEAEEEADEAE